LIAFSAFAADEQKVCRAEKCSKPCNNRIASSITPDQERQAQAASPGLERAFVFGGASIMDRATTEGTGKIGKTIAATAVI
jgi:hypothetical protein